MLFYNNNYFYNRADLKTPVVAVEPNRRLLAKSYSKPGIVSRLSSANDIFKSQEIATYDKILLCCVAHHFNDPDEVFTNLLSGIKSTARCLVTNLSTEHMPYMWRDAQDRFNLATQADIPAAISRAGFKTKTFTQIVTFKCTKEDWYSKLRRRIFSSLQVYTDEEIEEGIDELENTKLRGVPLSEEIELPQGIICTVATLPSYKI